MSGEQEAVGSGQEEVRGMRNTRLAAHSAVRLSLTVKVFLKSYETLPPAGGVASKTIRCATERHSLSALCVGIAARGVVGSSFEANQKNRSADHTKQYRMRPAGFER